MYADKYWHVKDLDHEIPYSNTVRMYAPLIPNSWSSPALPLHLAAVLRVYEVVLPPVLTASSSMPNPKRKINICTLVDQQMQIGAVCRL